jgi:Raf kinase inhibitor-like YbhB/YbcL family protein
MRTIKLAVLGLFAAGAALGLAAIPASAQTLRVSVDSFKNGGAMPNQYAFCVPAAQGHTQPGLNINPRISWSKGPAGTKSYAIILYDTDSPAAQREKMNQEGMTLTTDVPRRNFYHWVLINIPASVTSVAKGEDSNVRVVHGKPQTPAKVGLRGLNSYTQATASNPQMAGAYFGYDGPCPPWNDEQPHRYHFTVYALSVKELNIGGAFDATAAMAAIQGKVLAQGEALGLYSQNPAVIAKLPK